METDSNIPVLEARKRLFLCLDDVIGFSKKKIGTPKKLESDYQSYLRILVSAVSAYGKLLELSELDLLEQRLTALEQTTGGAGTS